MNIRIMIVASMALLTASCQQKSAKDDLLPISKPVITIEGDRLTPEALWSMGRIGSVQVDKETGWIAYTVSYYSIAENRSTTWIRICAPNKYSNGNTRSLHVIDEFVGSDPAWFGNSGVLTYMRSGKLFLRQHKNDIPIEGVCESVEGFVLSPLRNRILIIHTVAALEATAGQHPDLPLASGRIVNDLMYKHWDEWVDEVPQPFVVDVKLSYKNEMDLKKVSVANPVNLLEGTAYECPMRPFGGIEQLAWAPDNETIAYTCRKKTGIEYALSTNSDIYLYNIRTGACVNITEPNGGYDTNPAFSPNGQFIAWQSMERDGYESDENRLMVMNLQTKEISFVSKGIDTNVDSYYWRDNEHIVFNAVWHGTTMLYETDLVGNRCCLTEGQYDFEPIATPADWSANGDEYYCLRHSMREPNEIYKVSFSEAVLQQSGLTAEGGQCAITHRTALVYAVPESVLAIRLEAWEEALPKTMHLAYLPKDRTVRLRLSGYDVAPEQVEAQFNQMLAILGDDVVLTEDKPLEVALGEILRSRHQTISTAESCTGGKLASLLNKHSGSSDFYWGSVVAYDNSVKAYMLGVPEATLQEFGAVSEPVVRAMAEGVKKLLKTDYAIATSGVAGPTGGTPDKPVGTVWVAWATPTETFAECLHLGSLREQITDRACAAALIKMIKYLHIS